MPKKKIQHKGKPKHATEESEDVVLRKKDNENTEEEYPTVVDFEVNKKYSKRLLESNWFKYEDNVPNSSCDFEANNLPKTDDFSSLLESASSDCSHFQFSSEKLWKSDNSVPASKFFELDVNLLSSRLQSLPLREMLNIDALTAEEKETYKELEKYCNENMNLIASCLKKHQSAPRVRNTLDFSGNLEELFNVNLDLAQGSEENENESKSSDIQRGASTPISKDGTEICKSECDDKVGKNKQKIFLPENDENLEDWLDSVLDD